LLFSLNFHETMLLHIVVCCSVFCCCCCCCCWQFLWTIGAMNVALLTVSVTLLGAGFTTIRLAHGDRHSNSGNTPMVLSPEDSYIRAVSGFGTELECYANTCVSKNRTVKWFKDNKLIAEGTDVFGYDGRAYIRHGITLDHTKDCNDTCYTDGPFCAPGLYCLENSCCACESEDYTLVLTNLTYEDTGTYRCQMTGSNDVEMDLEILEYGLLPSKRFYTFDHSECCEKMGVRSQCLPLCKPSMVELHKFDPVACEDEYEKLLSCVTEGGNVSHVHCCRINFVPVFCWEFCHGQMTEAKRSNQFCIYWMPEIFDCYERAYLPFPGPPEKLTVNAINSSALMACWQPPRIRADTVDFYTVRYQEVPRFPFLGGGIPFLTGEGDEVDGSPLSTVRTNPFNSADVSDRFSDSTALHHREKRQSLLIMTHNLLTNETDVREYKFNEVNTTDTCAVIDNLKASTHYLVFATASNSFGVSLPTSKQTAATEAVVYSNSSLPDVYGCCKRNLVSPECISKLCDLNEVPLAFSAFSIAVTCRSEFADKGVGGECLKLCDGTASDLGLTSVLCLSLDMHAIYSCLREGYITHPSPPQNVSVSKQGPFSAIITWDPPVTNADDVQSYSLFVRDSVNKQYDEIKHATSPYELIDLEPNSVVSVYVLAHTSHGSSLKSTVIDFFTGSKEFNFCESGMPLRGSYGEVVKCDKLIDCPAYFFVRPDFHIPVKNISECCQLKGVEQNCLTLCSYNVSVADMFNLGSQCIKDIKTIVDCAGVRLPGPPTNLRLLEENHNWVKLTWDPPEQSVPLEHYEVIISENSRIYSEPSVEYLAVVLAWNKYGSSVPSNHITFTTESSSESGKLADDRPLSPHSINKVWYHEGSANITWQWSGLSYLGNSIKSHIFKVMYKKSDAKNWNQIETNESSAVLKDLEPHSVYVVYVTAYDTARGINSFPSETVEFSTWQGKEVTELAFVTVPRPPFQVGSSIVVSCVVRSGWVYNLTMKAGDEVVAYGRDKATYTIDSASSSDALKSLLCIGEISPVVSTSIYPVVVYAGANAQLSCHVRSYPMMTVQWVHEHNSSERTIVLPESGRYAYITDNSESPFSFNVSLMISKVTESDSGFYSCLACNEIDCAKATAYLIGCCQEKHVQEECLSACTVDIDVSVYMEWIIDRVVSQLKCRTSAMPAPPTNVRVDPVPGSGVSLNVSWLAAPKNYKMATTYIVYYQQVGAEHFSKVRTEQPFAILSNLNVSSMYAISVIAANHNGFSSFSPTVSYHFPNADHWDYIASSDGNHMSSAGVLFIVFFVLFLLFAVILSAVYFTRRPYLLPTFLLKLKKRPTNGAAAGSVAFENPGYEREGQVRVLPSNGYSTETPAENPATGWDRAELEAVREPAATTTTTTSPTTVSEQDGMRYTRFR
ncbi:Ig-like and fibronectin type-III domain-containing protein C25G4.10, partial [Trichinella pseudospiralis]